MRVATCCGGLIASIVFGLMPAVAAEPQPAATVPAKPAVTKPPKPSWNPIERARAAARRTQSTNNLRQIMLAVLVYEQQYGQLPAAYIADKNGKPLLSWRVAILPAVEQEDLYKQFHLDEPWDSEHNKKLVAKMPEIFKSPSGKAGEGKTNYLAVRGPQAAFVGKTGLKVFDFKDGMSNTIMVVEADDEKAVEWTKPDDLDVSEKDPLAGLGGIHPEGFLAANADGSVHVIPYATAAKKVWAMFTRNGGETVDEER